MIRIVNPDYSYDNIMLINFENMEFRYEHWGETIKNSKFKFEEDLVYYKHEHMYLFYEMDSSIIMKIIINAYNDWQFNKKMKELLEE